MGRRSRNKGGNKPRKVASTLEDLSKIIDVEKSKQEIIPPVIDIAPIEPIAPIAPIVSEEVVENIAPENPKTPLFKVPPRTEKSMTKTGVISGIQRTEPHNNINMLKIGTIIDGVPMIYTAQRKNFDINIPFKVNDKVEFILQKFFHKGEEKFIADKVKLVTTGVPIMDDIIAKMQDSPTIIAYSENQLRVLITEYAAAAKSIEAAIKAIEEKTKLKFVGKTDVKYPMFAFEKC